MQRLQEFLAGGGRPDEYRNDVSQSVLCLWRVCLFVCLPACLSVCLSACMYVYMYAYANQSELCSWCVCLCYVYDEMYVCVVVYDEMYDRVVLMAKFLSVL